MAAICYEKKKEQGALILPRMGADGGFYFECCQCQLVHRIDFSITPENGLEMRVYGDEKETEKARERWLDEQ
jgi:hypothetical protein